MNAKKIVSAALLLLVAASVAVLVRRELRQTTVDETAPAGEHLPANAVVVYYFHGDVRCPTCRNIENYSHEAVQAAFAEQMTQEKLLWKVVNYEQAENSCFVADYELVSPTVVLVRIVDGKAADWRNLARVWELVGDRDAFTEYVQNETRSMLGS